MIRNPPEFENSPCNQFFGVVSDTGRFDLVGIRTRIRRWMVVFQSRNVDIVTCVWMLSPPEIHLFGVSIMELVIASRRPLDVNARFVGRTQPIVECNVENRWMEILVEFGCRKRFHLFDNVAYRQQGRAISRSAKRM